MKTIDVIYEDKNKQTVLFTIDENTALLSLYETIDEKLQFLPEVTLGLLNFLGSVSIFFKDKDNNDIYINSGIYGVFKKLNSKGHSKRIADLNHWESAWQNEATIKIFGCQKIIVKMQYELSLVLDLLNNGFNLIKSRNEKWNVCFAIQNVIEKNNYLMFALPSLKEAWKKIINTDLDLITLVLHKKVPAEIVKHILNYYHDDSIKIARITSLLDHSNLRTYIKLFIKFNQRLMFIYKVNPSGVTARLMTDDFKAFNSGLKYLAEYFYVLRTIFNDFILMPEKTNEIQKFNAIRSRLKDNMSLDARIKSLFILEYQLGIAHSEQLLDFINELSAMINISDNAKLISNNISNNTNGIRKTILTTLNQHYKNDEVKYSFSFYKPVVSPIFFAKNKSDGYMLALIFPAQDQATHFCKDILKKDDSSFSEEYEGRMSYAVYLFNDDFVTLQDFVDNSLQAEKQEVKRMNGK